jgi:hypothetical protein
MCSTTWARRRETRCANVVSNCPRAQSTVARFCRTCSMPSRTPAPVSGCATPSSTTRGIHAVWARWSRGSTRRCDRRGIVVCARRCLRRLPRQALAQRRAPADAGATVTRFRNAPSHRRASPRSWVAPSATRCATTRSFARRVDTSLPQGPLLAGRIAHEVIAQSLLPHGNPEVVATRAASAVDAFIQGHAPSLCLPASRPVRHHLRVSTARTGALLAEMCADIPQGVFTEHSLRPSAALGPVRLRGRADIIVREPATVLDLKWSAAGHRRALAEGTALQLALYAWALREAQGGAWADRRLRHRR